MNDTEIQVEKHLVTFCKYLPTHVSTWESVMQDSVKPLQVLVNLCEQIRHVKKAKMDYFEDFDAARSTLLSQISTRLEEELLIIKTLIEKLNKSNFELKTKMVTFERSTLSLNWENSSELIDGNGTRPKLTRLLMDGLEFANFFFENLKNISDGFKALDVNDEGSITKLQKFFDVEMGSIGHIMALTQYVDNEKAVN